jgi:DNA-binding PadR family transcriptional regulator
MEKKGYVASTPERRGKATRRVYRATPAGIEALHAAKGKLRELFGEVFRDEPIP